MAALLNFTKDMCKQGCNTNPKFNPTLSAGEEGHIGLRNPIMAIGVESPEMAQKIIKIQKEKELCLSRCDLIKDSRPKASPELMNKLKKQYQSKNPFKIDYSLKKEKNDKKIDLTVKPLSSNRFVHWTPMNSFHTHSRFSDAKIQLLDNIGGTLEPLLGTTITSKITSLLSNKITPEELIKLVPKIASYFQSSKNIKRVDTITAEELLRDISQKKQKDIYVNGAWLHNNKIFWGYAIKWKRKRWGWHVCLSEMLPGYGGHANETQLQEFNKDPSFIHQDAIKYFAGVCAIPESHIYQIIFPPSGRGEGNINEIGYRWRVVWEKYKFTVVLNEGCTFDYKPVEIKTDSTIIEPKKIEPDAYCTKCKRKFQHHIWSNGFEGTLCNNLCESCYKIYSSKDSTRCEKCGEVEHYHLWSDGWSGMCYNGLCENCTINKPEKNKVKLIRNKLTLAKKQYNKAYQECETYLCSNSGETPPIYQTNRFKNRPWYSEYCRLWTIQSHLQSQVSTLQRRLEELC